MPEYQHLETSNKICTCRLSAAKVTEPSRPEVSSWGDPTEITCHYHRYYCQKVHPESVTSLDIITIFSDAQPAVRRNTSSDTVTYKKRNPEHGFSRTSNLVSGIKREVRNPYLTPFLLSGFPAYTLWNLIQKQQKIIVTRQIHSLQCENLVWYLNNQLYNIYEITGRRWSVIDMKKLFTFLKCSMLPRHFRVFTDERIGFRLASK